MKKEAIVRLALMVLSWINTALAGTAYDLSWINEEMVSLFVAFVFSAIAGWKDNPVTKKAVQRKQLTKGVK